jgi:predicted phosphoribosyltransferase
MGMQLFKDRIDAANQLAEKLLMELSRQNSKDFEKDIVVLAIPRGGVVIGDVIASRLGAKLDLVIVRKIGSPNNPEFAIGAIMPDGQYLLDINTIRALNISQQYIESEVARQLNEIQRRITSYRGHERYDYLEGKVVILVDDGIATGSTIYAAARWLKDQKCKKLIIAVPVMSAHALEMLKQVADMVVCVYSPSSFEGVGQFYQDFHQVTDEEVMEIMRRHKDVSHYDQKTTA